MKKLLYALMLMALASTACNEEDGLIPSGADKEPARERPDMDKPLIAGYKDRYDVSIIYRFTDSTDYKFTLGDENSILAWRKIKVRNYDSLTVDYGLEMLDSLILRHFKDEIVFNGETFRTDFRKTAFPRVIFLADSLAGDYDHVYKGLLDLNNKEGERYFSFIWNGFEPMFAFNRILLSRESASGILKYRNSALYCFLKTIFVDRGFSREFPEELFSGVEGLYYRSINALAEEEDAPVNYERRKYFYTPEWYMSKGFALTNNFPKGYKARRTSSYTYYTQCLDTTMTLTFPGREEDICSMLHVVICENNAGNIRKYFMAEAVRERMRIFIRELYRRGIDVFAVNPATKEFFNE